MKKLSEMPGIGVVNERNLNKAGINTPEELIKIGSEEAYTRIGLNVDNTACINVLYGLETAVQGIRRGGLSAERKSELKKFFDTF